jgi:hypothetical protein
MKREENRRINGEKNGLSSLRPERNERSPFSFGGRRYKAAKRLFVPQKSFLSPTFAVEGERTGAILRVISTGA